MRTPSKIELIKENAELRRALDLREAYLMHAFRSEVHFVRKGSIQLGFCGETRAHGGIVLEAMRDENGKWSVTEVAYWEDYAKRVREYPARYDDKDAQDRRTIASQCAMQINAIQAEFYSTKIAEACEVQLSGN